jgi:hypothetical protein
MYGLPTEVYGAMAGLLSKYIIAMCANESTSESYSNIREIQQHASSQPEESALSISCSAKDISRLK